MDNEDSMEYEDQSLYRYDLINDAIKKQGLTPVTAGHRAGLGYLTMQRVVEGRRVSLDTLVAVSKTLDIPLNKLFTPLKARKTSTEKIGSGAPAIS